MANSTEPNPASSVEDGSGNQNIYPLLKNDKVSKLQTEVETQKNHIYNFGYTLKH